MGFKIKTTDFSQNYLPHFFIFLPAVGVRFAFLFFLDEPILFYKYPFFAEKLAKGGDIGARLVDLSPFYLYFLTFLKKFNANWDYVKFFQSFVGSLTSVLLYASGSRVFPRPAAFMAALLYAVYGNLIILESTLEPTVFVLLFNLLAVYFLLIYEQNVQQPRFQSVSIFLAGLFTGISIITKPSFLLFIPLALFWLLFICSARFTVKIKLVNMALFLLAALLVIAPISIRNYVKINDFVLVTADAGKVFYRGNGRGATALEGVALPDEGFAEEGQTEPDYAHTLFRETASRIVGKPLSPSESSKFWIHRTIKEIISDPTVYVIRELKKLVYFFTDYEMHYIASAYKEYKVSLRYPFLRYGIISSLGILGIFLSCNAFKKRFLGYGMVVIYLISGLLFLVQSRYRTPAVPYLCLFAGYSIYRVWQMMKTGRYRTAVLTISSLLILLFFSYRAFNGEIVKEDLWQTATKIHYQMGAVPLFNNGKYEATISELTQCLAIVSGFTPAYNLRGKTNAILGKYSLAELDFKKVIELSPNLANGYKNLGLLYLLQGKEEMAKKYLESAQDLDPKDEKVRKVLIQLKSIKTK
jgi:4-amino-4-deoxy-L-arabinose transferase-like glycosyltransferase